MSEQLDQRTSASSTTAPMRCVTIDVEEYFHIEAARSRVKRTDWGRWPSRVEASVDLLLALFHDHRQRGTFFVLGHVAQRHPHLVRRISEAGHEVASHGTGHDRLHDLTPERFREDVRASKALLEDQIGKPVLGYRAPTFSVVPETAWAIDILVEEGFTYDASIFPVHHPWYGVPGAPDHPFRVQGSPDGATLLEVPPLTWGLPAWPGRNQTKLAVAGGGYFRLMPLWLMRRGLAQAEAQQRPAVLYFHPWEFDPELPRMPLSLLSRLRTYTGLRTAAKRLGQVMAQPGRWGPIADDLEALNAMAQDSPVFRLSPDG